jgi:hypothetical protein
LKCHKQSSILNSVKPRCTEEKHVDLAERK